MNITDIVTIFGNEGKRKNLFLLLPSKVVLHLKLSIFVKMSFSEVFLNSVLRILDLYILSSSILKIIEVYSYKLYMKYKISRLKYLL